MADTPPPPPGFTIDQPQAAPPPPPPGFRLDAAATPPPPPGFQLDQAPQVPQAPQPKPPGKVGEVAGPIIGEPASVAAFRERMTGPNDITDRGTILPVGRDIKTGKATWAVPEAVRSLGRGLLDVVEEPYRAGNPTDLYKQKNVVSDEANLGMMVTPNAPGVGGEKMLVKGAEDAAKGTKDAIEKLLSPTTVSESSKATEKIIRRATGESGLAHEKAADRLMQHNKTLANLPVPHQRAMVDAIENGLTPTDPKQAAAAKDIRQVYDGWKNRVIQVLPKSAVPNFINDYYAHIWKEKPSVVGEKMGAFSKQGSGRSFKQRTIPTISDGIKAGLTPKFENPVETTMAYSQNMSRYVATHDMMKELKTQGYAKWYSPGSKNIPPGWQPYDGIMTKKIAPVTVGTAKAATPALSNTGQTLARGRPIQLYGPPDATRVFNNFISKGMESGDARPFYQAARSAANGMTQMKLGLSTFHLGTIANEAMISDYARAFRAASRGELKTAGKALLKAPTAPYTSYTRGMKMQRELLDKQMPDATSKVVNDAFVRSGGQLRMDPFYRTRASGSFYNALQKGTFKSEAKAAADQIYKGTPWEKVKGVADLAANAIQTTAAPLFEHYIPAVKRGAFASDMEDFLKSRPNATQKEIDQEAIKIQDSIDNRFGELNQDNLFWNKTMKQAAQLALLSPTWDLGTVREIAGGLKDAMGVVPDLAKGEGISRRTAYVAGLAFNTALMSSVYQYLKTGKAPSSAQDLMAPKTGGTDVVSGKPERAITPGYQKDVYAFGYDFPNHVLQESANKLNPFLSSSVGLIQNKDYRGLPIYRPEGVAPVKGEPGIGDYLLEQYMPISIGQFKKGEKIGSNIGPVERGLSIRAAPSYLTDPQRLQEMQTKYGTKDWQRRLKADAREQSRQK